MNFKKLISYLPPKPILIFGGILIGVYLIGTVLFSLYFHTQLENIRDSAQEYAAASIGETAGDYPMTLRIHEGKIGIFPSGEEVPTQILNVYVFTLPYADRLALNSGIRVYSEKALRSLIEDFTG